MKTKEEVIKEIAALHAKIQSLEKEIQKYQDFVAMYKINKGKFTIQVHPKNQSFNLLANGWKYFSNEDLKELSNYIK